jgi:hypothetical protein
MDATGVKQLFETIASRLGPDAPRLHDERVIETMADTIDIDASQTIVDVGTGFIAAGSRA